jgi:hypothetical protein
MKYAIKILEKEKQLLEDCLKDWKIENYPEAFKDRNNKLRDIDNAIQTLITKINIIDLFNEKG